MVILEAMACGVIPVVTGVGDIPNVLKNGVSGFVLPAEDETKIVEQAVSHIIELTNNPELTNKIRKQARQDVQAMFSEATFVSEWKKVMDI
jgi:L-malate glycosyltransferase